jgi:hypothetical protein
MRFRTYLALFLLLAVVYLGPVWLVVHPPAMDLPAHLALATVMATHGSRADPYASQFLLPSRPTPNTLYHVCVVVLGRFLPLDTASRILFSLAVLLVPLGLAAIQRARGADIGVSLFGFALAATFNLVAGFIGFALGLPLLLVTTALAAVQAKQPSWPRGVLLAVLVTATFFAHAQLALLAVGLLGVIAVCVPLPGRRVQAAFATLGPATLPFIVALPWYIFFVRRVGREGGLAPEWDSVGHNLGVLPLHTFDTLSGEADVLLGGLMVAVLVALVVLRPQRPDEPLPRRRIFDLLVVVNLIGYFALPCCIRDQLVINGRHAVIALLFLAAAVDVDATRRLSRWALRVGVALVLLYGLCFARATLRMGRETGDLQTLLTGLGPGARLAYVTPPRSAAFTQDVFRHVGCYVYPWNHGHARVAFAHVWIQPVRLLPAGELPDPGLDPDWKPALSSYDAVLTGVRLVSPRVRLVGQSGVFRLYRVVG